MTGLRKQFGADVQVDDQQLTARVSTNARDRVDDRLDPRGAQLDNFLKTGGPVLWAHCYAEPPIAKTLAIAPVGDALVARMEFAPTPFAQQILELYRGGFMRSFSVGFAPLEGGWEPNEFGGRDYRAWELLEFSAVPVPANPEATALLTAKGLLGRATADAGGDLGVAVDWLWRELGLDELDDDDALAIPKGVIGYKRTPLAPESTPWDAGAEVAAADVEDLRIMCTWYAGDGTKKGDYKLPHHHASGNHACVWRGVANAAARLSQTSLPAPDVPGVKKHLAGHYRDFGREPPWKAAPEAWHAFETIARTVWAVKAPLDDAQLAVALDAAGFVEEAAALRPEPLDLDDVAPELLAQAVGESVGEAVRRGLDARLGRLPP